MSATTPTPAPEFVSTLQETAEDALVACLVALNAAPPVLELARSIRLLALCPDPETVIETANLIVQCGGVFRTTSGYTIARPFEVQA